MFYESTARANVTQYLGSLADAFKSTQSTFNNIVTGNTLVDKVPSEYEIVTTSIKTSDSKVEGKADTTKNLVTFTWKDKLEKKVYEVSFFIKLKKDKVPANYISEKKEVYSNGTTIDITKDSTDSAIFTYGSDGKIGLKSPTLKLSEDLFTVTTTGKDGNNMLDGEKQGENVVGQQADKGVVDASPKTDDTFNVIILCIVIVAGVICTGSFVAIRKRR